MKKCISLILSFVFVIGICVSIPITITVNAINSGFAGGSGTENDPYLIETKEHLNNVRRHLDAHYKMIEDIVFDVSDFEKEGEFYNNAFGWEPIATVGMSFQGSFDGNNHFIKGLTININESSNEDSSNGLFGGISNATIKNLKMEETTILVNNNHYIYAGCISGWAYKSIIDSCSVQGVIIAKNSDESCALYAGGIIGEAVSSNVTNVESIVNIKSECNDRIGGICGHISSGLILNATNLGVLQGTTATGGVAGEVANSVIENCINYGDLNSNHRDGTMSGSCDCGGTVAWALGETTISRCSNHAQVSSYSTIQYGSTAAGIVATMDADKNDSALVSNCYNSGQISAGGAIGSNAGGISGTYYFSTIRDCYNLGEINSDYNAGGIVSFSQDATIETCYNVGNIIATYAGGIVGEDVTSMFNNCLYKDTIHSACGKNTFDLKKYTTEEMQQKSTYEDWDFENVWGFVPGNCYKYPTLNNNSNYVWIIDEQNDCVKNGKKHMECTICGTKKNENTPIPAKGHSSDVILPFVAPTCISNGLTEGVKCSSCGTITKEQQTISALGHTTSVINAKSATCTVDGYTGDTYCSTCKSTVTKGSVIKATGHNTNTKVPAVAATCTATGLTEGAKCSVCGIETKSQETVPVTGHKTTLAGKKDATTKEAGYTGDQVCSVCNELIEKGTEIPKLVITLSTPEVAIKNTANGIELSWNTIENAENYILYKKTYDATNKKWSGWKTVRSGYVDTSYTDTTVILGTQYRYTVRAVNGEVMSKYESTATLKYNVKPTVKISNVAKGVKVTWTKAANATGYTVYRSTYSGGKWSGWKNMGTAKATKSNWTDKNVKSGVQYKYTVRACYNKIKSSYKDSNVTIFLTQPTVKFANASTGIKVSWSKVSGATGYTVYRSQYTNGKWSGWKNMGTAKSTKSSWTDKKVESGATYKYTVRAVNGNYKSTYTDTKGLLYLAQPTVTVKAVSNGINVAWSQCEGATGYTVYRSEYNTKTKKWSSWKSMGTAKATKSNWIDTKTTKGVQYKYTVRAVNADTGSKSTYVASKEVKR